MRAVDEATYRVEKDGWGNASDRDLEAAYAGMFVRAILSSGEKTREHMDAGFRQLEERLKHHCAKSPRSRRQRVIDHAKLPALITAIVTLAEAVRAIFS